MYEPEYGDELAVGTSNFSNDLQILTYSLN